MNNFKAINTDYIRPSRTIETVLISNGDRSKVFLVYNYEGNSFRVFDNHLKLILFFQNKSESDYHFKNEEELDLFLENVSC